MVDVSWQQAGLAALRDMLDVDGHTRKSMIEHLFKEGFWDASHLSWDSAVARWNDCLNPGKPAFFKLAELWSLMRAFGRHQLLLAMIEDLGYEVRRKPTEERRQELLSALAETLDRTERGLAAAREALANLELGGATSLPAPTGADVRFSLIARTHDAAPGGF